MCKKPTILVVDDMISNIFLIESILEDEYRIVKATSVKQAREVVCLEKVDLILSDFNMPLENGLDFCNWLNENKYEIPFIIITAIAPNEIYSRSILLGVCDIIQKPLSIRILKQKIQSALIPVEFNDNRIV